jgi:hypothetical protein
VIYPVITLYGPWANWIALEWKTIETRLHDQFACLLGRRIGIHLGRRWDETALKAAAPYLTDQQLRDSRSLRSEGGVILCTAHVHQVAPLAARHSRAALIDCGAVRRWGLFLDNIEVIEPIPCSGKQGIWRHEIPAKSGIKSGTMARRKGSF